MSKFVLPSTAFLRFSITFIPELPYGLNGAPLMSCHGEIEKRLKLCNKCDIMTSFDTSLQY